MPSRCTEGPHLGTASGTTIVRFSLVLGKDVSNTIPHAAAGAWREHNKVFSAPTASFANLCCESLMETAQLFPAVAGSFKGEMNLDVAGSKDYKVRVWSVTPFKKLTLRGQAQISCSC